MISRYLSALWKLRTEAPDYGGFDCGIKTMSPIAEKTYIRELNHSLGVLDRLESDFSARSNYILILNGVLLYAMFTIFFTADYLTFNISDKLFFFTFVFFSSVGFMVASVLNVLYCVIFPGTYRYGYGDMKETHRRWGEYKINCGRKKNMVLVAVYDMGSKFFQEHEDSEIVFDEINTKYYFYEHKTDVLKRKSTILSAAGTFTFLSLVLAGIAGIIWVQSPL